MNMKKNKSIKILLILLVVAITTVLSTLISSAYNYKSLSEFLEAGKSAVNNTITIGNTAAINGNVTQLCDNDNLYCLQKDAAMNSDSANYYKVIRYIKIEGNTATNDKGNTVNSSSNKILAYILAGGSNSDYGAGYGDWNPNTKKGYHTSRQKALYRYFNNWVTYVGSELGIDWTYADNKDEPQTPKSNKLYEEARAFVKNPSGNAQISSKVGKTVKTSNTMAGPFKVKYVGEITSVEVKNTSGNTISKGIKFYSDKDAKNEIKATEIESEKAFYIKNASGEKLGSVTVSVKGENAYTVELWFLKKSNDQLQRLLAVKTHKKATTDSVTIGIEAIEGTLKIVKIDKDTKEPLRAGFAVWSVADNGYVLGNEGNYTYNNTLEKAKATPYYTDSKNEGTVVISGLKAGDYIVREVEAPEGYDITRQKNYDKEKGYAEIGEVSSIETGKTLKLVLRNRKYGKLTITKKDGDTKVPLRAGFVVWSVADNGYVLGNDGAYTYTNTLDQAKATPYYTDSKTGELTLKVLKTGDYIVREVEAPEGYDLKSQTGYNEKEGYVELGNSQALRDGEIITFEVTNKKSGDLMIIKSDKDAQKPLKAGFAIWSVEDNGYVLGSDGNYTYTNTLEQAKATPYYTSESDGTLSLGGLKEGTYIVREVEAPEGYDLTRQVGYNADYGYVENGTANTLKKGEKVTYSFTNKKSGDLTIVKEDKDSKIALRAGFVIWSVADNGYVLGKDGNYTYKNTLEQAKATPYYTDSTTGKTTLKDLKTGEYIIREVEAPEGYDLKSQPGYNEKEGYVELGNREALEDGKEITFNVTNKKSGDLEIYKRDKETGNSLKAGFAIWSVADNGYVLGTKESYTYTNTLEQAKASPYYTDSKTGYIKIEDLKTGEYEVREIEAPEGYDLKSQEGYNEQEGYVELGRRNLEDGKAVTYKVENTNYIAISGYVWVDVPETKDYNTNSLYDSNEKRVEGVTVNLKEKSTDKVIATTKTDSSGNYKFTNISESALSKYYIEFNYNGTNYSKYIPVAFNSEDINNIKENGSRAIMNEVAEKDSDLSGVAITYKGSEKESTYGLSGNLFTKLYNSDNRTLENINLGIKELKETEYMLTENIAFAKIELNGYTYTYNYGGKGNKNATAAPTVKWQHKDDITAYSLPIYPSDVAYEEKNPNSLKVYVTYRIDITNTVTYNIEDIYKEQKMMVTGLTNKFDTSRYILHDNNWSSTNGSDVATINKEYLDQTYGDGIQKEATKTSFIEFEVKRDAILEILKHPDGIIENNPTKVTSTAYHIYTRNDYSWVNDIIKEQTHRTSEQERTADAPYLIFKLNNTRKISGKVFEDTVVTTDGQKLGDGKYENENVVEGVKVELLDVNGNVTNLYGIGNDELDIKAKATTDKSGNFTIGSETRNSDGVINTSAGIVPGEYYLRFTYGDGTQEIYDTAGNKQIAVNSRYYKSTIVTSNVTKDALENESKIAERKHDWYKKLEGDNYSVAVDSINSRVAANEDPTKNVEANTPRISVSIENTDDPVVTASENGTINQMPEFKGFNLGIIRYPEQRVEIEKIVTNMKFTNSQNNQIFNGNPETTKMKGVSDLDGVTNGGSTYARVEIEEDSIYGSTIELTYQINVTNTSDINYYGKGYYWYGDKSNAYEVTMKIDEVIDTLDKTLSYKEELSESSRINTAALESEHKLKITGWGTLYTDTNKSRSKNVKTSDSVKLVATRVLSTEDDDMEIVNKAQVTKASISSEDSDPNPQDNIKTIPPQDIDSAETPAIVTITPPTGEDRQSPILYIITGAITLALLSAGIVVIKKKVL